MLIVLNTDDKLKRIGLNDLDDGFSRLLAKFKPLNELTIFLGECNQ